MKTRVARLLNLLRIEGLNCIDHSKQTRKKPVDSILKQLEGYCIPKRNEVMEHFKFFTRKQLLEENFDKFYLELWELVQTCSFGDIEDNLLRAQIVLGVASNELQTYLLRSDLPLEKSVKLCQALEQAESNCKLLAEDPAKEID